MVDEPVKPAFLTEDPVNQFVDERQISAIICVGKLAVVDEQADVLAGGFDAVDNKKRLLSRVGNSTFAGPG